MPMAAKPPVYNCRIYNYPSGQHVTFYKRTVNPKVDLYADDDYGHPCADDDDDGATPPSDESEDDMAMTEEQKELKRQERVRKVSFARTKNRIYQISRSNADWHWFVTLTFDREKIDASDYDSVVSKLQKTLDNIRQRKCPAMKYLIVPELHADLTHYHFHGTMSDVDGLTFFDSGIKDKHGETIYNIREWTVGFSVATRIKDNDRVSSYISKYVTKTVYGLNYLKNKRRYYFSKNIEIIEPDYYIVDHDDFLALHMDRITHSKQVIVTEAHQVITYYELDY